MENSDSKTVHMNIPQMMVNIVAARETWCVWGRGTGKSEGVLAPAQLRNVQSMPRSLGINVGATFSQILVRTLPAVIKGWEKLGYRRDEHYFIGHYAPKEWRWDKPYFAPIDGRYIIHWYTGAAILMVSQDGHGMANGISADYIHGDEAKLLNYDKLKQELFPVNRGNNQFFAHLPQHHSLLFTTDRPTSPKSMWILEKAKLHNQELVDLIITLQYKLNELHAKWSSFSADSQRVHGTRVRELEKQLALLRMACVYYSEASSLSNIHALGEDYFKQMKRNLPKFEFETSILNMASKMNDRSFYPMLDENVHTYEKYSNSFFENTGYDLEKLSTDDCRKDGDCDSEQSLDISIDYGAVINIMAVGQQAGTRQENIIKEFFVSSPRILDHLIDDFVRYYRFHRNKVINYYFDHTAIASSAASTKSFRDIVVERFQRAGWQVRQIYTGQAPHHEEKYLFWNDVLAEESATLPVFRMNRANCPSLKKSMEDAGVKQSDEGFKKDKSSERNKNIAPEFATHGSDAVDMLMWGKFKSGFQREESTFIPNIIQ